MDFVDCIVYPFFLTEDRCQKFTKDRVIKRDTVGLQKQESTTYLPRTAVVELTFVITILFIPYVPV